MKSIIKTILLSATIILVTQSVYAQNIFSLELRTGADFATQELGDADLNTGFGFDGILTYRIMPHTSIFGGWGWHRFTSDDSFAGSNMDFEETGYTFGMEFLHPLGNMPMSFYIRGGGIYNHVEVENSDGDITADSDHGLGWQAGAGVAFDIGNRWMLKPGVRYRSLSRDIEVGNVSSDVDLTYFNIAVGIAKVF
ncbi:Outer membrane protein beta-barrel domain-containing protein [Fodinibius roseus]|uniref:Outer membrane protein beta-barrel domain-containing protein n=1 Tax=Fodinibius roseus TaxID=1194090 RepID=A0A1M4X7X3_9BACT|nr:outer membrane beta-barrel protein [Fodinibius roseus]SHE89521.1 Outer membrane protein beta-barrel domain-containing protein [Fodinibius roseus]